MTDEVDGHRILRQVPGSGEVSIQQGPAGPGARFYPSARKMRHGFFELGKLSGVGLDPSNNSILKFTATVEGGPDWETSFALFLRKSEAELADAERLKFFASLQSRSIAFMVPNALIVGGVELILRVHRDFESILRIDDMRLIAGLHGVPVRRHISISPGRPSDATLESEAIYVQDDNMLIARWLEEEVHFVFPEDWRLRSVSPERRQVVDDFLFGNLRHKILGEPRLLDSLDGTSPFRNPLSDRTILSFSAGEDSTAALCVLPPLTPKYYCKRSFTSFYTSSGRVVRLRPPLAEEHALSKVPDCLIIESDIELLSVKFGGRLGYPATLSVAAIGILLADYAAAGSVSIGAQLETSYLQNGQFFKDVHAERKSAFNKYKRLFGYAGLEISYRVAALSEVLTSLVVARNRERYFAVPCPHTDESLRACGRCFKCFRKLQLSGEGHPRPNEKTRIILRKRPLKMATSALYAARKGGYHDSALSEYDSLHLGFLDRYYDRAIHTLVPSGLQYGIRQRLADMGLEPMSEEEVRQLVAVGAVLAPEAHRKAQVGLQPTVPRAEEA